MTRLLRLLALSSALVLLAAAPVAAAAFFNDTPRGEKPTVTPQLLLSPVPRLHEGDPLVLEVAFKNLDYRPDLRAGNALATLGMSPQVTTEGRVRGHIHAYAQRLDAPTNQASPFCIFEMEHRTVSAGFDGVAARQCGTLTAGEWRVVVDVNTDYHDGVYKPHPQQVPATDAIRISVKKPRT